MAMLQIYLSMLDSPSDREKFEILYQKYHRLMYHIAFGILHQKEDAEDCVHNAFLGIIKNIDRLAGSDDPATRAFIVAVTETQAYIIFRKNQKTAPLQEEPQGVELNIPQDDTLSNALASLPVNYRTVLLLRYHYGCSLKEAAAVMDVTYPAVRKMISRAKAALARKLEDNQCPSEK